MNMSILIFMNINMAIWFIPMNILINTVIYMSMAKMQKSIHIHISMMI